MPVKASVVTTVFNGEEYFDRALPSILAQSYEDFEYIIVDDGSDDATADMLHQFAREDSRIRVLSPGRLGFVGALNYGIDRAEGEYIFRQDFDDRSYPDRLHSQVSFLDAHPDVALVGGYSILVDENRGERYVRMPPLEHQKIVRSMARCIPFAHTIVAFRKEAWSQAGGYPDVKDIEDLRLWISFVELGWRVANIPEVLGEHWVHADSYWHQNFDYRERQRTLQRVQLEAIRRLDLPLWTLLYPLGRYAYSFLPPSLKRLARRSIGRSAERDLPEPAKPLDTVAASVDR